ncbi:MAG: class I SAM-dependent methyltransferase [Desertimonas sp.]
MDLRERVLAGDDAPRHPWERSRARVLGDLVSALAAAQPIRRALDVGAGDDWLARSFVPILRHHGAPDATVTCWDVHYTPEDLARPAAEGIVRTATEPAEPAGDFDLVTALDVIEHVADDDVFVRDQIAAKLTPGGRALISVPAYQALFADHDRMLGHHRRYRPAQLRAVVGAHLDVVEWGSFFTTLLIPRAAQVVLERLGRHGDRRGVGEWTGGPRLTTAIERVLDADATAGRRLHRSGIRVPGLSAWLIARRAR